MSVILIADSSEVLCSALAEVFRQEHNVYLCHTGDAAVRLLDQLQPDAMILDLVLPSVDGFAVLRTAAYTPPVILATTNFVSRSVMAAAEIAGIKALFRKPVKTSALVACLQKLIGNP